ncbi:unnamed protein product [Paramecium primaurelia]|uniref:Schlafen AlbA-2 domain-containing protein n=2 Tax=Paramecium TaxID=5884 RepID=A0A8S1WF58_9CILI|nr:unnamed protein product [Paramecium primaurelia]CAD8187933.1 unnamed protein product [Paramecium pentaurelia]
MNKQSLQEFKVNSCQNPSCQVRQDHFMPLQQIIQCQYYHNNSDKRRNSNNYKPIYICDSNNEVNDFCNNIIEYLYHPRIYGTLPCKFEKSQNCNVRHCPFKHDENQIKQGFQYKIFTKLNQILESKSKENDLLFNSKKYIQRIEINQFEDLKHEFKQFKEIRMDLIMNYICAFLNSQGGILYIGITDKGIVQGIKMTRKQKDDFQIEFDNNLRHFDPIVLPEQVELMFVPIYKDELIMIQDLFVIEIKINVVDKKQLYFTNLNEAYIKRNATINQLKPKEIKQLYLLYKRDLVLLKLMS